MKYAKTHTISQSTCYDLHKKYNKQDQIVKTSLCALEGNGNAEIGVCNGDSGGPLADWSDPKHKSLIGIVSWEIDPVSLLDFFSLYKLMNNSFAHFFFKKL